MIYKCLFLFIIAILGASQNFAQMASPSIFVSPKEYSKDVALYHGKSYLIHELLGPPGSPNSLVRFEMDPIVAASSGGLTTLLYDCKEKGKAGLILGFYGDRLNDHGFVNKFYAFKHLPKDSAVEMLSKVEKVLSLFSSNVYSNAKYTNVYFTYGDLTFMIYKTIIGGTSCMIRVFWNDFDSEWEEAGFNLTKTRIFQNFN